MSDVFRTDFQRTSSPHLAATFLLLEWHFFLLPIRLRLIRASGRGGNAACTNVDPSLYNHDLAPIPQEKRSWGTYNYASLWVAMSVCIPTYMLASGLIAGGMNWYQAVGTILLGNLIVLIPMLLNAHAGTRYGIPFPVFVRASFGVRGANVPAVLRALVACGWFGIQSWIGGQAIYSMLRIVWPGAGSFPSPLGLFFFSGLSTCLWCGRALRRSSFSRGSALRSC